MCLSLLRYLRLHHSCIEVARIFQSSLSEWGKGGNDKGGKRLQLPVELFTYLFPTRGKYFTEFQGYNLLGRLNRFSC